LKTGDYRLYKLGVISQEQLKTELSYYWVLIGGHLYRVNCHNNVWLRVTANGRFTHRAPSVR